jgi:hypothetical protein
LNVLLKIRFHTPYSQFSLHPISSTGRGLKGDEQAGSLENQGLYPLDLQKDINLLTGLLRMLF